jgi:hypothetical protein
MRTRARQLAKHRHYTHLPTSFERFRRELNRKKSKFERYGLVTSTMAVVAEFADEAPHLV